MVFMSGLLLGTFLGFFIAGLCAIVRENPIERLPSVKLEENIDEVA